jgi:hypothetical protein
VSASAFNADYWIAAAAATAPVLALASTVALTGVARIFLEIAAARQRQVASFGKEAAPINIYGWLPGHRLTYAKFLAQAVVLVVALISLQRRAALVSPWITTAAIGASLLLVGAQASRAGRGGAAKWRYER